MEPQVIDPLKTNVFIGLLSCRFDKKITVQVYSIFRSMLDIFRIEKEIPNERNNNNKIRKEIGNVEIKIE